MGDIPIDTCSLMFITQMPRTFSFFLGVDKLKVPKFDPCGNLGMIEDLYLMIHLWKIQTDPGWSTDDLWTPLDHDPSKWLITSSLTTFYIWYMYIYNMCIYILCTQYVGGHEFLNHLCI